MYTTRSVNWLVGQHITPSNQRFSAVGTYFSLMLLSHLTDMHRPYAAAAANQVLASHLHAGM